MSQYPLSGFRFRHEFQEKRGDSSVCRNTLSAGFDSDALNGLQNFLKARRNTLSAGFDSDFDGWWSLWIRRCRNTLSAGFDSDSRPNWACCDARFQGRFTASPHIHLQRGVTKIGHHAVEDKIRNPKSEIRNKFKIQMFKIQNKNNIIRYSRIHLLLVI